MIKNCKVCKQSLFVGEPGYEDSEHVDLKACIKALGDAVQHLQGHE